MSLTYTQHEILSLKAHATFTERWLQDRIAEDPTILGLGGLALVERERIQERAGRLDLLLTDEEGNQRFEVELMLGATDESHIIRTLEYWDIERRRYPGYDHTAVIVAEDITSRFLNVLSLLSGTVPLVAIQLSALQVGSQVILNFVKVLDQRLLRRDDEHEAQAASADRAFWEAKSSPGSMMLADQVLALLNERVGAGYQLYYNRQTIGLFDGVRPNRAVILQPRKRHLRMALRMPEAEIESTVEVFEESGLSTDVGRRGRVRVTITGRDLEQYREIIGAMAQRAVEAELESRVV